jgi:hypothetical protein
MCRKLYMYMCATFAVYMIRSDIMYIYADTLYITNNTRYWKLVYIFIIGYIHLYTRYWIRNARCSANMYDR